ncbi:hypothetical protein BI364_14150 [Acidihalobacter yilgarnensis]|uniref:Uncharacterized protein n=1 Tax=Acidihalobacter yilgarnensis TaxID=2819280 RepID=A0A1D8IR51_9GAMM|nr:hypothetical protein [Acidihalobacter yilgarnensis]AOU98946.1 hypothetical protein BI364_14150 [Acidihalobacter yilgarnensis]
MNQSQAGLSPVEINTRCVELFLRDDVRQFCWHPRMFWVVNGQDAPNARTLVTPKVDLMELEVLLSSAARVPSTCAEGLNDREAGRADFIQRNLARGDMPYLRRPL